ncbi:uncharacterized protein C8A04DRAFT_40410 [Dichotomopilus funicola]|uniref:Uncharacterized protein n=1 Tax=Dichotomopilus funicola TaxID=1934379 RepID=A0AAN6UVF9_9PEZI|nr:hypothetical protein C8A04DRAFT_40410 [Dichotomopilus funicola]
MAKRTPAARLRRTFRYPSDDDDDNSSLPEVLDEQEQESLIESLALQNAARNKTTHTFLSVFPPLSAIPFLIALFFPPSHKTGSSNTTLVPLLGLSSLAATSWMLYHLNVTETGFPFLDSPSPPTPQGTTTTAAETSGIGSGYGLIKNNKRPFAKPNITSSRAGILGSTTHENSSSPLTRYLPILNIALALLTFLTAFLQHLVQQRQQQEAQNPDHTDNSRGGGVNPLLLGALPGIVYAVVIGAKMVMASVDPERELSGLKYRYKGA